MVRKLNDLTIVNETQALLKSPGGWFFASNAILYMQTAPEIALAYLSALLAQRVLHYKFQGKKSGAVLALISGPQGILAVNGLVTLLSAILSFFFGPFSIFVSGLLFGLANTTQAIVYGAKEGALSSLQRHIILAVCEFLIAFGLAMIAVNAGYSVAVSFGLIVPVVGAGIVRSFRAHWLPPGLAYADMMILSLMTCVHAFAIGNLPNAISRVLVLFGLTRLAVLRAKSEGKKSWFEVERFFSRETKLKLKK